MSLPSQHGQQQPLGRERAENPGFGGFGANWHLAGLAQAPEKKLCPEKWLLAQGNGKC